jgi:hypothetical protein
MRTQRKVLRAAPVGALIHSGDGPGARREYQIWAVDLERCPVCGDGPRSTTTRVAYADCAGDSSSGPHAAPVDVDCPTCPVADPAALAWPSDAMLVTAGVTACLLILTLGCLIRGC